MNLRDRRQLENKLPDMSGILQTDRNEKTQNWSDTILKYRMLLEEQSGTIRIQKAAISEQEKIICQQVLDIGKQGKKISELQSSLEQGRINLTEIEDKLREQYESRLSEKDSQILQAQNLAQDWKKKVEKAEQGMSRMEQSYSSQISRLKSEIQNLNLFSSTDVKTAFELFICSLVKAIDETNLNQGDENDNLIATWHEKLRKYINEQQSFAKN